MLENIPNGDQLTLAIGSTSTIAGATAAFAHCQNASISFSNSLNNVTTKGTAAGWDSFVDGRKSFTITGSGFIDFETVTGASNNFPTFSGLAVQGTKVFFEYINGEDADSGDGFTGEGFISDFSWDSNENAQSQTYSVTITGSGALVPVAN